MHAPAIVSVNGRSYRRPQTPTVVVCIDGSEPGYIEAAIAAGLAPNLERLLRTGSHALALNGIVLVLSALAIAAFFYILPG